MANEIIYLTEEGYKKLLADLKELEAKRPEIVRQIAEARDKGDLSENAEYDAAKEEQRNIDSRIEELKKKKKNAEVIDEDEIDKEKISIGCKVKVRDISEKEDVVYRIVGSTEANSLKGKISNESPVGKALIGLKVGQTAAVETPAGVFKYKVLEIIQ